MLMDFITKWVTPCGSFPKDLRLKLKFNFIMGSCNSKIEMFKYQDKSKSLNPMMISDFLYLESETTSISKVARPQCNEQLSDNH